MQVELGKIVGVWGVKGWIKLHSYTRNRQDISDYRQWFLQPISLFNTTTRPAMCVKVLACRQQGAGIVAQLEGIGDRDAAAKLIGLGIFVNQTELPTLPEGEYYWQQLIGLLVVNEQGSIGTVDSILETGANDVLVCKSQDPAMADVLIPYTPQVIKKVNLEQGTVLVDWDPAYLA